jgi:hypothetical protein
MFAFFGTKVEIIYIFLERCISSNQNCPTYVLRQQAVTSGLVTTAHKW